MGYILNGLICYFKKSNTHTVNQSKSSAKCPVFTENALRYRIIVVYVIYIATVSNTGHYFPWDYIAALCLSQ